MHLKWWIQKLIFLFILFIIYFLFWMNILKIKNTHIRTLRIVLNYLSDGQYTMLIIAIFTPSDLLKVCVLYTDTASLMLLWSMTLNTFYLQCYIYFWKSFCLHIILFLFFFFKRLHHIYMYIGIIKSNILYTTK